MSVRADRDRSEGAVRRLGIRRWRRAAGPFLIFLVFGIDDLVERNGPGGVAIGLTLLGLFVAIYLLVPIGFYRRDGWVVLGIPLAMAAVFAGYAVVGGQGSLVLLIYVAVAVASLHTEPVWTPVVLALCAVSALLPPRVGSWDTSQAEWGTAGMILVVSLLIYGFRRDYALQAALRDARAEVERLAAERERLRIGRDMHDVVGQALTTVAVKAELAQRLVAVEPGRAAVEMEAVAALARDSLADVRATVAGYREVSLASELATAAEVLRAAGIDAVLPSPLVEAMPRDREELCAWLVREGVTNAVRHSRARRVTIRISRGSIEVIDDGIGSTAPAARGSKDSPSVCATQADD